MKFRVKREWNGRWVVQARYFLFWITIKLGSPFLDKGFEYRENAEEYKQMLEERS